MALRARKRIHTSLIRHRRLDKLHLTVLGAVDKALEEADPEKIIRDHVHFDGETLQVDKLRYKLDRNSKVVVIGGGKASGYMGHALGKLLSSSIGGGLVMVPDYFNTKRNEGNMRYVHGSHPIPSQENARGVKEMVALAAKARESDLVVILLSGVASSLMAYPLSGISLSEERITTHLLLSSGAHIREINTVRKHISRIGGGRLAELLPGRRLLTLTISDVVGDDPEVIGSGPAVRDPTTYGDSKRILEKYNLWQRIPIHIRRILEAGLRGRIPDTPKDSRVFQNVENIILARNRDACTAAVSYLAMRSYKTRLLSSQISGEARVLGGVLGGLIFDVHDSHPSLTRSAMVAGGETTVTVRGRGKGGRNQELALAAAVEIENSLGVVAVSVGTDGIDGPTNAAGAIVDGTTVDRGRELGMNAKRFLERNDSYNYLSTVGDLVLTGPTGTNLNDIMIVAEE